MPIPERYASHRMMRRPALGVVLLAATLASCATAPQQHVPVNLERPQVQFSTGRMTVVIVDEYGITLPGMQVNVSWEEPFFYKTSAFTNRQGEVSFAGVPQIAEVSIDHPAGNYTQMLLVPQSGRPELRVTLDTMGGGELMRERERARLAPPPQIPRR
jgi:hypothetical protein